MHIDTHQYSQTHIWNEYTQTTKNVHQELKYTLYSSYRIRSGVFNLLKFDHISKKERKIKLLHCVLQTSAMQIQCLLKSFDILALYKFVYYYYYYYYYYYVSSWAAWFTRVIFAAQKDIIDSTQVHLKTVAERLKEIQWIAWILKIQ